MSPGGAPTIRRVGPRLLIFLWIWAGLIFLVLDLFLNVAEFDPIRPRAQLYRGMRAAAHDMIGEPLRDAWRDRSPRAPAQAWQSADGGRDEVWHLRRQALVAGDPVVAGQAIRSLGRLQAVAGDARLLDLLDDPRLRVRQELVIALGASRDPAMVPLLAGVLGGHDGAVRPLAVQSLGQIGGQPAERLLEQVAIDPGSSAVERRIAEIHRRGRSSPALRVGSSPVADRCRQR